MKTMIKSQLFLGDKPEQKKFNFVKNRRHFNKPEKGLWTSTYNEKYGSDWLRWCISESFGSYDEGWLVEFEPSVVYEIDCLQDLNRLIVIATLPLGTYSVFCNLDFEKLSEKYDAVHLTEEGQCETRFNKPSLYGWDCESTLWLKWKVRSCEKIDIKKFRKVVENVNA